MLEIRCHLPPPEFRCSSPRFLTAETKSSDILPCCYGQTLFLPNWTTALGTPAVIISSIYWCVFTQVEKKYDFGSCIGPFRALWRNGGKMTWPHQFHSGADIWQKKPPPKCCCGNASHIFFWGLRKATLIPFTAKYVFFASQGPERRGQTHVKSLCLTGTEQLTVSNWRFIIYGQKRRWFRIPSFLLSILSDVFSSCSLVNRFLYQISLLYFVNCRYVSFSSWVTFAP